MQRLLLFPFACLCTLALFMSSASAQEYPTKPIRMLIGFSPGGGTDVLARTLASKLSIQLGQPVVPENRPGASGIVAAQLAATSPADGYTMMFATSSVLAINAVMHSKLPYDPVKSFVPVSLVALLPMVVVVNPSMPVHSLAQLVAFARAKPGSLSYGNTSDSIELAAELFAMKNGIKMAAIPYKGASGAINDFIGGRIQVMFDPMLTSYPLVEAGKERALAVTTAERSPLMPKVPSISELKMPAGYDVALWHCVVMPAGTPPAIVNRVNAAIKAVLSSDDLRKRYAQFGAEPKSSTPQALGQKIVSELARWKEVVADAGISPKD